MKKLLLLLFIAPMIGNSQLLDLPVSEALILTQGQEYTVPDGKIMQLVTASAKSYSTGYYTFPYLYYSGYELYDNTNTGLSHTISGYLVIPSGYRFVNNASTPCSFVVYDLEAQNLAYNIPNQTTPTLYPNPTSSLLALNSDKEYEIEVYDMLGNKLMALTGNSINMQHLSTATYIVKATDKTNNKELTYKVVKN